jgi:hypothetical protein
MSKRDCGTDLFSFERATRSVSARLPAQQHFPYENAWKEFERLHKTAQGGGPLRVVVRIFEFSISVVGIYGFHLTKGSKLIIFACLGAAGVAELFYWINGRKRFLDWQCPRCHSEWPGTKNEKDRACRACGLRLHQMSP